MFHTRESADAARPAARLGVVGELRGDGGATVGRRRRGAAGEAEAGTPTAGLAARGSFGARVFELRSRMRKGGTEERQIGRAHV